MKVRVDSSAMTRFINRSTLEIPTGSQLRASQATAMRRAPTAHPSATGPLSASTNSTMHSSVLNTKTTSSRHALALQAFARVETIHYIHTELFHGLLSVSREAESHWCNLLLPKLSSNILLLFLRRAGLASMHIPPSTFSRNSFSRSTISLSDSVAVTRARRTGGRRHVSVRQSYLWHTRLTTLRLKLCSWAH